MKIEIAPDASPGHLVTLALAVHNIVGMPVAIRGRDRPGVLVARGEVQDTAYSCEALDSVFAGKPKLKARADRGKYAGHPMFVSAIAGPSGVAVAAIGVIDTAGVLSLKDSAEIDQRLNCQVRNC